MRQILLRCDDEFYYKMLKHKAELEADRQSRINWDEYVKILFGAENGN